MANLLGDGSITRTASGKHVFQVGHCKDQVDYLRWKHDQLKCISNKIDTRLSGYSSEMHRFKTKPFECLSDIRGEFYSESSRILPKNLDWIDDECIAIWYMDDGSLKHSSKQKDRATLHTERLPESEVNRLAVKINSMYGVDCVVQKTKKGFHLRINAGKQGEIDEFWKRIAPVIHPSMNYKLPEGYRHLAKGYDINSDISWDVLESQVVDISTIEANEENFPSGACGYDIETSTKNYIANGVCVHNSLIKTWHDGMNWQIATRGTAYAESENYTGKLFRELVLDALGNTIEEFQLCAKDHLTRGMTHMYEFVSPNNRVVTPYDKSELIYLGSVDNMTGVFDYQEWCVFCSGMREVETYHLNSADSCVEAAKELDGLAEGFVVRDLKSGQAVKIKSPLYVKAHHVRSNGINNARAMKVIFSGERDEYLKYFNNDAVYFDECDSLLCDFNLDVVGSFAVASLKAKTQKEFAMLVKDRSFSSILFAARRNYTNPIDVFNGMPVEDKIKTLSRYYHECKKNGIRVSHMSDF